MAKAIITIEDHEDGRIGVTYKLDQIPQPTGAEDLTLALHLGLTMFDGLQDTLKRHGAILKQGGSNAPTPGREAPNT